VAVLRLAAHALGLAAPVVEKIVISQAGVAVVLSPAPRPMPDSREPSHPPSDPHPALVRGLFAVEERPMRVQLIAALVLGLVLVGTGLFLWRRPHVPAEAQAAAEAASASASAALAQAVITPGPSASAAPVGPVALSEPRVVACHDRGSKKTAPDQCDHVAPVEKALEDAIRKAATCVPTDSTSGTIEYVADVSFSRHKVLLTLPRGGRSLSDKKVLHACSSAIRSTMQDLSLDGIDHQHARYSIAVTATYRGSPSGG
jgi:hypothetical protein